MKQPLAYRMRPTHIDEVAGQQHIIGKQTALYKMLQAGTVPSLLLYGEPGIGKTSIANAIAGTVNVPFEMINATTSGKKDIEAVVKKADKEGTMILAIDEVHRFNKIQQDSLLPFVENGKIILIAMTTENPFHSVLPAVRSRCSMIKQLQRLTEEDVVMVLKRSLSDKERGLGEYDIDISDEVLSLIARSMNGEIRSSLNTLEMAFFASQSKEGEAIVITEETVKEFLENKGFSHDKDGDAHYNVLSSFQKSIRGSDVDAALHYLGRLIEAGDMTSICRRLGVIAFEDIGLANPQTWSATMAAIDCAERVGFPEARIPLASAVSLLCLSPKSNTAYQSLDRALEDIRNGQVGDIPPHLKDSHYKGAKVLGHGVEYRYPHNYSVGSFGGWVPQQYLPDLLKEREYYIPKEAGQEKQMAQIHQKFKEAQRKKI